MVDDIQRQRRVSELYSIWENYRCGTLTDLQSAYEYYAKVGDGVDWPQYFSTFNEFAVAACEWAMKDAVQKLFTLGLGKETIRALLQHVIDSENKTLVAAAGRAN